MNKQLKTISLFISLLFMIAAPLSAQQKTSSQANQRGSIHFRDSLIKTLNKTDTGVNSLLQRIEEYTTTFNQIENSLSNGLDTAEITQQIPALQQRIEEIKDLSKTHRSSTLRYLFVLRDNLDHVQVQLETWQNELEGINSKLVQNQKELYAFTKDTLLRTLPNDSLLRHTFFTRRRAVYLQWKAIDSTNRRSLLKLSLLQDKVAEAYITVLDETEQIDSKIKRFGIRALSSSEYSYIWNLKPEYNNLPYAWKSTISLNKREFDYFITHEMFVHIVGFFFLILTIVWINFNRRSAYRAFPEPESVVGQAKYIFNHPIISPLIVTLVIVPFFYDHPPVVFLEGLFILAIAFVLYVVKVNCPKSLFNFLHMLFWITLAFSISNLFIEVTNADRLVILFLSILSVTITWIFLHHLKESPEGQLPYTKTIGRIFIVMHIISIICNITGRFSLAKIIGVTAVYNLWLILCFYFVVSIILQNIFLQVEVKKARNHVSGWLDYELIHKKFRTVLNTIAGALWVFTLLQNLNIEDWAHDYLSDLMNQPRTVGGASFTFGGFVIFITVIWLSSVTSKTISYFYDSSGRQLSNLSGLKKKNRTSTLLIRLTVFALGFLLAVAASGFPLDKITIIISAFGIGIGFGLQNIVNNLVSGLILAFEKPVQIGDIIEVDTRSGVITEIGIRSSRIATSDGSEVIVPNGDLISHHVINWTLSNNNRRVELIISVAYGSDIEKVKTLLTNLLGNRNDVMTDPAPAVFLHNLSQSTVDFRILFWAADISTWVGLKSQILADIYSIFNAEGIKLPFPQSDVHLFFPEGIPGVPVPTETNKNHPDAGQ